MQLSRPRSAWCPSTLRWSRVVINDKPHAREHAIEVELPFLRSVFGDLPIVPLLFGSTSATAVRQQSPGFGPMTHYLLSASDVPGFQAYYVVYAPDDTVMAISIFDNYQAAEESKRRGLAWIEQNLAPLLAGPITAVAEPVIVHTLA
jgi:AmmeMemoRadiSam system protein B